MAKEMVVLQGKSFSIELQSMIGSTLYGWSLTGLPQGIALLSTENIPTTGGVAPIIQRFWFGAYAVAKDKAEISFMLVNYSNPTPTDKKYTVSVKVIPSDSEEFAKFSENSDGMVRDACGPIMPYGYALDTLDANQIYGYLCTKRDVGVKYGFPDTQNMNYKYGYPCDVQNIVHKYGYPCGAQDAALKYGFPCDSQYLNHKYGYPCGVQDANFKYGYPCASDDIHFKYGYPCGVQDVALKYGYPTKPVAEASIMYGYKCDSK